MKHDGNAPGADNWTVEGIVERAIDDCASFVEDLYWILSDLAGPEDGESGGSPDVRDVG